MLCLFNVRYEYIVYSTHIHVLIDTFSYVTDIHVLKEQQAQHLWIISSPCGCSIVFFHPAGRIPHGFTETPVSIVPSHMASRLKPVFSEKQRLKASTRPTRLSLEGRPMKKRCVFSNSSWG